MPQTGLGVVVEPFSKGPSTSPCCSEQPNPNLHIEASHRMCNTVLYHSQSQEKFKLRHWLKSDCHLMNGWILPIGRVASGRVCAHTAKQGFFKALALRVDAFYKSKCTSVCVSVCPSVHFWGTFLFGSVLKSPNKKKMFFWQILPYKTRWKPRFPMD